MTLLVICRICRQPRPTSPCANCKPVANHQKNNRPQAKAHRTKQHQRIRNTLIQPGSHCARCGSTHDLTIDYILPLSLGGHTTLANARILCRSCNSSRGNRAVF